MECLVLPLILVEVSSSTIFPSLVVDLVDLPLLLAQPRRGLVDLARPKPVVRPRNMVPLQRRQPLRHLLIVVLLHPVVPLLRIRPQLPTVSTEIIPVRQRKLSGEMVPSTRRVCSRKCKTLTENFPLMIKC